MYKLPNYRETSEHVNIALNTAKFKYIFHKLRAKSLTPLFSFHSLSA